jgi:hypothetical protein
VSTGTLKTVVYLQVLVFKLDMSALQVVNQIKDYFTFKNLTLVNIIVIGNIRDMKFVRKQELTQLGINFQHINHRKEISADITLISEMYQISNLNQVMNF